MKRVRLLLATALAVLTSCGGPAPTGLGLTVYRQYECSAWRATDPAAVRVKVSLALQRVYVMEGERLLLVMPVTVGDPATPTPTGEFRITHKERRRRSASDGYATLGERVKKTSRQRCPEGWRFVGSPLPYWCGFAPGLGFHTGWIKHHPASDGCIRMHENVAPRFFELVRVGTPVEISASQPEDASHGSIPLPPDSGPLPDDPPAFYVGDGYFSRHTAPVFE